jgi:hypothetical protein
MFFAIGCAAMAQQIYFSSEPGENISLLDWSTGEVQLLLNTATLAGKLDSLILNSQGQMIYSASNAGQVWLYDPTTGANTLLAGGLYNPRDLAIEPGGATMLIANYGRGQILRYNFSSGTVTILAKKLVTVDGIAYDPHGDLFAVVGRHQVCQIDPLAGTLLKCIVLEPKYRVNGGDGMVYDSYSGQLWVTHVGTQGNGLIEIPTDLSTQTWFQTGKIPVPDGIVSDGQGNLFIGAALQSIVEYNIPTDTIVKTVKAKGVDDLVLVPGTFASVTDQQPTRAAWAMLSAPQAFLAAPPLDTKP